MLDREISKPIAAKTAMRVSNNMMLLLWKQKIKKCCGIDTVEKGKKKAML